MKRVGILAGLASAALAGPALAGSCEPTCADIPRLEKEIAQQEFLRDEFRKFTPQNLEHYQLICSGDKDLQNQVKKQFNKFLKEQQQGGTGAGYIGTDFNDPKCPLVEYEVDKDGKNIPDPKNPDEDKHHPLDVKKWRAEHCDDFPDAYLSHEKQHQKTCRAMWKAGKQGAFNNCAFYAADDVQAYQADIDVLKGMMRKLMKDCGWDPSKKPLPPKSQMISLNDSAMRAANALKGGRK